MRVIYKQAVQAHAVPATVIEARGPFRPYEPVKAEDQITGFEYPPGATAQNGMREVVMYECSDCLAIVREDELQTHECEE